MSTYYDQYAFWGYKLDPKKVDNDPMFDKLKEEDDEWDFDFYDKLENELSEYDLEMVYDGMSGEYCMIGKILAHADGFDGEAYFDEVIELKPVDIEESAQKCILAHLLQDKQPKMYVFTHCH